GVDFVQVPTTLLAMVDAAIGGKNGVDLGFLKNQVGLIHQPNLILIAPDFLETLPENQLRSGFAEMLKHGLIQSEKYWNELAALKTIDASSVKKFIKESIIIKSTVVDEDPNEGGLRKILNFGHTLGHAIETHFLTQADKQSLLHGEAIAIGMILEAKLSQYLTGFSESDFMKVSKVLNEIYKPIRFSNDDIVSILSLLKHDKKNSHGNIQFVLLEKIGQAVIDVKIDNKLIVNAFNSIL
ncbi:MAG: 3-dehydroquinate synthase family protein, partial [Flavobacteriaceae bacterium]|nr:3-dehydroquinate synthase family protein [Flavobacteriaceae bacterium]